MNKNTLLNAILADTRGATAVEYGLIVSLIVIAIIGAVKGVGGGNGGLWGNVSAKAIAAMAGAPN